MAIELYSEISIGMDVVNVGVSSSSRFFILRLCKEAKAWQVQLVCRSIEHNAPRYSPVAAYND